MTPARWVAATAFAALMAMTPCSAAAKTAPEWKKHPALAEPDGRSHRGDRPLAANIDDPRVLAEISRRFRKTAPLRFTRKRGVTGIEGERDFERRQEYFPRLLDHYWFSKQRLLGMSRPAVERIFGPLGNNPHRAEVRGGRDSLHLTCQRGRVTGAFHVTGY